MTPDTQPLPPGSRRKVIVYADGGSRGNPGPAAIGVQVVDDSGNDLYQKGRRIGRATNNEAEYQALIDGLEAAAHLGAEEVLVRMDSELVVKHILGLYRVRSPGLLPLYQRATALKNRFPRFRIEHVPRLANSRADALANQALDDSRRDTR